MEVDIPGVYCNKTGEEQFAVKLCCVDVIPESHYNLMSITRLMEEGHKMTANSKDGITLEKNGRVIKFDMRIETPKGVLWCAYIKRNNVGSELAAGLSDEKLSSEVVRKDAKVLEPILKMHISRAHAILGHASEDATRKMAAALNMLITRGGLKTCEACAIAKAKQMNVVQESEGEKAQVFNGRVFHDIAIVKADEESGKKLCKKGVWHICVDELVGFKRSTFFTAKSKMPEYMCELMQSEMKRGHPILIIRQDNTGKNKKLTKLAHSKDWKLSVVFENTARKTPLAKLKS